MSVRVLSWVLEQSPVEHRGDLLVLIVLADHAHDDGTSSYPSVETLGRKARLSRRGVQLALRRLEDQGAIEQTSPSAGQRPATYRIVMAEGRSQCAAQPLRSEVADAEGRSQCAGGAQGSAPEPSLTVRNRPVAREQPPAVTYQRRTVPAATVALAEQIIAEFDRQAGTQTRTRTAHGRATDSLHRVVGRLVDFPDAITADTAPALIRATLAAPWWEGSPSINVVFGPRVIERNLQALKKRGPIDTSVWTMSREERLAARARDGAA